MSKYEMYGSSFNQNDDIRSIISEKEELIWTGKPKKSAFVLNKCMVMFPFALIWLAFDGVFIFLMFSSGEIPSEMLWFIIPFFALHLMPVWIWLSNVLSANRRWRCTEYAVTNLRIIIKTGFLGVDIASIYYKEINNVRLKVGLIDKLLGVGDIHFETSSSSSKNIQAFLDIEDVHQIYPKLQQTVVDIQMDIHFPNNMRPDSNDGYNTKYRG